MILFDLRCSEGHAFEAWFRDSKSYDKLALAGEIRCAVCGSDKVEKALMAPNVRTKKAIAPPTAPPVADKGDSPAAEGNAAEDQSQDQASSPSSPVAATPSTAPQGKGNAYPEKVVEVMTMLRKAQTFIEKNFDSVGNKFADEARKIHYGEAEKRGIYGEATKEETEALADEGIEVNQIPWLPSRDS